jgi:hypothetical protein
MDIGNKLMNIAIGVGIGVVVIVIVSTILGGSTVLGSATLGSFTGFTALAGLVPIVLIGLTIYLAWESVKRRKG